MTASLTYSLNGGEGVGEKTSFNSFFTCKNPQREGGVSLPTFLFDEHQHTYTHTHTHTKRMYKCINTEAITYTNDLMA